MFAAGSVLGILTGNGVRRPTGAGVTAWMLLGGAGIGACPSDPPPHADSMKASTSVVKAARAIGNQDSEVRAVMSNYWVTTQRLAKHQHYVSLVLAL